MRAYFLAAFIGAAFLPSCAQLDSIERGTCGNSIVEPEAGEDCDSFPADQCHAPGSKYACRFACDTTTQKGCPEGWGCGAEGVCRQPTSTFAAATRPSPRPTARLFSGDFDGDGKRDVVGLAPDELRIHYFDDADPFGSMLSLRPASLPAIGDLTASDSPSDIAMASAALGGMSVLHGRSDRSMLPLPFSFFSFPDSQDFNVVSLEARPTEAPSLDYFGEELVIMFGNLLTMSANGGDGKDFTWVTLPRPLSEAASLPKPANLWDDPVASPWDELVLTWKDATEVSVLTPCKCTNAECVKEKDKPMYDWNMGGGGLAAVALPAGQKATSAAIATHLDSDAHLDLLVASGVFLYAAYGAGNGHFASSPELLKADPPQTDDRFGMVSLTIGGKPVGFGMPLTIGQLDSDGIPDLVVNIENLSYVLRSLPESGPNQWHYYAIAASTSQWSGAAMGDFNGNGLTDLVAWSNQARDLHFMNGTKNGYLNDFVLRTEGVPALVRMADMDGDFIDDLVYVDRVPGADDSLSIMFGRASGAPEDAVQVGRFPTIEDVVPTQIPIASIDEVKDVIVISKDAGGNRGVSIFQGATSREVQSPLWLSSNEQGFSGMPLTAAMGDFAADDEHHMDLMSVGLHQIGENTISEHLWLLPMQGDAQVDPSKNLVGPALPITFRAEAALMTAVDLDGSATEQELVMLGRIGMTPTKNLGGLLIARVRDVGGVRQLQLDPIQETPEGWNVPDSLLAYGSSTERTGGGQIRAVDIDADGRIDVAATGHTFEKGEPINTLVLFPNTGAGTLSAADAIRVPNNLGRPLMGFAFVQADLDPALELVLLSREQAWLLQVDLASRSFSQPVLLEGVGGGVDALGEDFDRDGVQDLVIADEDGLRYHKGIAVLP